MARVNRRGAMAWGMALGVFMYGCRPGRRDIPEGGSPAMLSIAVGPVPGPKMEVPGPSNPFQDDAAAIEGHKLFDQYNCSGCHGPHGGGAMGPSLRDSVWLYGDSDAQIFQSISEGRNNGMPAWGTKVPEQQIWKLVAYVKTLRTSREPDPPDESLPREPVP